MQQTLGPAELVTLHCTGERFPENLLPQLTGVVEGSCEECAAFQDLSKSQLLLNKKKRMMEIGAYFSIHVML